MKRPVTVEELIEFLKIQKPKAEVYYDYGGSMFPLEKEELESVFEFEEKRRC